MPLPPLVSADWLLAAADDPDLVILDASVEKRAGTDGARASWHPGVEAFAAGHVPRARFANLAANFSDPDSPLSFTRPSAGQFASAAGELGISGRSRIVVYDGSTGIWAARLHFLFRAFGHDEIAVLDGGLAAWRAAGLPLEAGPAEAPERADFPVRQGQGIFVGKEEVRAIVEGRRPGRLACVLRAPVFAGLERNYARPGHIPGSLNLPYGDLVGPDNRLRPREELEAALAPLLGLDEPTVVYCGGGITAAGTALALEVLGARNVAIYDGSLEEWSADPALPMAVAPPTR